MISRAPLPFLLLSLAACAYRVPAPREAELVPRIAPADIAGATVTVSDSTQALDAAELGDLATRTRDLLASAVTEAPSGMPSSRVTVAIGIDKQESFAENALARDGIAIIGLAPALFGMIIEEATVSADVTVEKDGLVYHGRETAVVDGSLFARARRRALAVAIDRALASATVAVAE